IMISAPIIHRRILKGELRQWYLRDVGLPFMISFGVCGLIKWFTPSSISLMQEILLIIAVSSATLFLCAMTLPHIRERALNLIFLRRG
ncbi:MAG: hypothetical protein OEW23_19740, partial [Candidatus Aminicenantes bacterium]|nr:hypothetical protein [Candidatus Aminicenantes bacterium]